MTCIREVELSPSLAQRALAGCLHRAVEVKWSEVSSLSRVRLFATPWTVAHQALPSMGFSRKEYWSGLPFPSPGDLPNPEIKPGFPALQADALTCELPGKPKASIKLEDVTVINVPKTEL